jgi:hypothetical protein
LEFLEKHVALVPLPRVHLVRYGGCLAPHSHLRGAIIPTLYQQGVEDEETNTGTSPWSWVRLLKRVFALDMARCPFWQQGSLRIIAAITQGEVIRKILSPLKLAADPPPLRQRVSATPVTLGGLTPRSPLCYARWQSETERHRGWGRRFSPRPKAT